MTEEKEKPKPVEPLAEEKKPEEKKPEEEKPKEAPKEEKAPAEAKVQAEAPAEAKKEAQEKKKKKINRLTLKELDKKIQEVQSKMGNLSSSYALQLLKRKKQLLSKAETRTEEKEETAKDRGENAT